MRTTRETPGGRNHRHEYAADGRLTRIVDPAAPSTAVIGYTYDARGNATSRTSATGFVPNTTPIVVDEANRVRSATVGADTETYTYDGLGRRTRVTVGATTSMHFYSQAGQLLLWESPSNVAKSQQYNIYLGTKRIARRHSTCPVYVHTDHLGSPLAETSVAPVTLVSSSPHWEPYGAPAGGAFWGALQYAGHYQDGTTRLTYMQQRYYDPYAGRFLAVDPVAASPGSVNRYWYATNNPYKYTDPDGRLACRVGDTGCNLGRGDRGGSSAAFYGAKNVAATGNASPSANNQLAQTDAVARQALRSMNKDSIRDNSEYGALIYEIKGKMAATPAVKAACASTSSSCAVNPWDAMIFVPNGARIVADIHTHGAGSDPDFNTFSPSDISASNSDFRSLPGANNGNSYIGSYLATPNGSILFYRAGSLPDNPPWDSIKPSVRRIE